MLRSRLLGLEEEEGERPSLLGSEVRRASLLKGPKEAPGGWGVESVKGRGQIQRALEAI